MTTYSRKSAHREAVCVVALSGGGNDADRLRARVAAQAWERPNDADQSTGNNVDDPGGVTQQVAEPSSDTKRRGGGSMTRLMAQNTASAESKFLSLGYTPGYC